MPKFWLSCVAYTGRTTRDKERDNQEACSGSEQMPTKGTVIASEDLKGGKSERPRPGRAVGKGTGTLPMANSRTTIYENTTKHFTTRCVLHPIVEFFSSSAILQFALHAFCRNDSAAAVMVSTGFDPQRYYRSLLRHATSCFNFKFSYLISAASCPKRPPSALFSTTTKPPAIYSVSRP